MELVAILQLFWARRTLLGLGALLAIVAGALVLLKTSHRPAATTWVSSARVLVDTSDSQLVNPAPTGIQTLPMRAALGADLITTAPLKATVAREAGVPAQQLDVLGPSSRADPPVLDELVTQAMSISQATRAPYVVSLYADELSPIVSIEANASDAKSAAVLADAAISVLGSTVASHGNLHARRLVVKTIMPPHTINLPHRAPRGPMFAAIGAVTLFAAWCAGMVLFSGMAPGRRRASAY